MSILCLVLHVLCVYVVKLTIWLFRDTIWLFLAIWLFSDKVWLTVVLLKALTLIFSLIWFHALSFLLLHHLQDVRFW